MKAHIPVVFKIPVLVAIPIKLFKAFLNWPPRRLLMDVITALAELWLWLNGRRF